MYTMLAYCMINKDWNGGWKFCGKMGKRWILWYFLCHSYELEAANGSRWMIKGILLCVKRWRARYKYLMHQQGAQLFPLNIYLNSCLSHIKLNHFTLQEISDLLKIIFLQNRHLLTLFAIETTKFRKAWKSH